jgi:NADPH:quinone reductase-like Zn-dependent oxidoreductase
MATMASERTERATMRAVLRDRYGPPETLRLGEAEKPELVDDGVLVRVKASSLNRGDLYAVVGKPLGVRVMLGGLFRPKSPLCGGDFAGVVEAVGEDVTDLEPGDEVFGGRTGAFAEYVCVRSGVARKPANLSFEEAAALPVAGITALQGLRDHGGVRPGQHVLVNGASGGVGTFAVQIAKALGAEVTAVCSTRNVEQAHALGADHVIDYTREDVAHGGPRYDVVFENASTRSWRACRRVLAPGGTFVMVGSPKRAPFFGPLLQIARMWLASRLVGPKVVFFVAKLDRADMNTLRELVESGQVRPVVERVYGLDEIAEALGYMAEGHARGKLVVTV